jgi:hypothetical protein
VVIEITHTIQKKWLNITVMLNFQNGKKISLSTIF